MLEWNSQFCLPNTYSVSLHTLPLSVKTTTAHPLALKARPLFLGPDNSPNPLCSASCFCPFLLSAHYCYLGLGQGFSTSALQTFWTRSFFIVLCFVRWLAASLTGSQLHSSPSCDNQKGLQMLPHVPEEVKSVSLESLGSCQLLTQLLQSSSQINLSVSYPYPTCCYWGHCTYLMPTLLPCSLPIAFAQVPTA